MQGTLLEFPVKVNNTVALLAAKQWHIYTLCTCADAKKGVSLWIVARVVCGILIQISFFKALLLLRTLKALTILSGN